MKNLALLSTVAAAAGLFATAAQAQDILARVISSTPVTQQVAVPSQYCNSAPMVMQSPPSGAGAAMGALAGGALGNSIGDGGGRAVATIIGLVGGAMIGNNIEGNRNYVQNVQQCGTQTSYENRTTHYDVVYEYSGKRYNVQMPTDPGLYVRLQVTPVGAIPTQPPQAYQQVPSYPQQQQNSTFQQYQQHPYPAQVYTQPTQIYVQPAPVYYQAPYPYVRPYHAPIGLSLNFGYSRGYHRHRYHGWR